MKQDKWSIAIKACCEFAAGLDDSWPAPDAKQYIAGDQGLIDLLDSIPEQYVYQTVQGYCFGMFYREEKDRVINAIENRFAATERIAVKLIGLIY